MKNTALAPLLLASLTLIACAQQPSSAPEDFFARGVQRMDKGDLDGAIADFNKAVAQRPDNPDAYFERGVAWCLKIEVDKALADFDKAISLAPNRVDFYKRRAQCRMRYVTDNEERLEVIADLNKGLAVDPKNAELYFFRGLVKHASEDFAGTLADYDRAVELGPDDGTYVSSRAHIKLAFLGDYAGAVADANRAISLNPEEDYSAYAVRGRALQSLGRKGEGARDIDKCLRLNARCDKWLETTDAQMAKSRGRKLK